MVVKLSLAFVLLAAWAGLLGSSAQPGSAKTTAAAYPPVEKLLLRLERDFELVDSGYSASHRGIDVSAATGEIIRSPVSGWIHFSGFVVNRPVVSVIDSAGELYSFEPACSAFSKGERVSAREAIAEVCLGGEGYQHCRETCLHISLRVGGQYLSPLARFGLLKPSRLYPLDWATSKAQARG